MNLVWMGQWEPSLLSNRKDAEKGRRGQAAPLGPTVSGPDPIKNPHKKFQTRPDALNVCVGPYFPHGKVWMKLPDNPRKLILGSEGIIAYESAPLILPRQRKNCSPVDWWLICL